MILLVRGKPDEAIGAAGEHGIEAKVHSFNDIQGRECTTLLCNDAAKDIVDAWFLESGMTDNRVGACLFYGMAA